MIWRVAVVLAAATGGLFAGSDAVTSGLAWRPLQRIPSVQVEETMMTFGGKEIPAQTITLSHSGSSFSNAVVLPLDVSLQEYNVISFRVKMKVPSGAPDNFSISVFNESSWYITNGPAAAGTKFLEHANEVAPGEYEFTWQAAATFEKFDMASARFLALIYLTQEIPEGETVKITVSEVTFQK